MKRTQIQLPDHLYAAAHQLAEQKEVSLAELVRRGLEYMIAVSPGTRNPSKEWALPEPKILNAEDPFWNEHWREDLHMRRLQVAEKRDSYQTRAKK